MQTTSFWTAQNPLASYDSLKLNSNCDVSIIGAGISGLSTAYLLLKAGKSVIVLDQGHVAQGETSRTSAHLSNVLDDHYTDLEELFGQEGAKLAAESHAAAIELIREISESENIDCSFEYVDAYLFNPPNENLLDLQKELEASKRAGLDAELISKAPFSTFNTGPSLHYKKQAEFLPLHYIQGLAKSVIKLGGKIYTQTKVVDIEEDKTHCIVKTASGPLIVSKQVVVATNSPINDRYVIHLKQAAYRTYMIGAKIPYGIIQRGLYYDTLDPYHYIRLVNIDNKNDLVLIGGEDHRTGEKKNIDVLYTLLELWARDRFPDLGEIEFKWSGQVLEPADSLAFMGRHTDRTFIMTGDSGNGLTHGTLGAIIIKDQILGHQNPWEKLYSPKRITLKALKEYATENANTIGQYTDWVIPGEVKSENEIKKDCGAILRKNGKPIACYRDAEGKLHKVSGICPHLYGVVQWNEGEKTWDCPCHGSRFDVDGKVLNTPAISDLPREDENP